MSYGDDYEGERGRGATIHSTPTLRTRKPTGNVAFPFLLIEGEPKGGKSFALAQLAASPRVGRTFVLELGETGMDEYASLGPFEMIVHNGTFSDIKGQIMAALAVPQEGGKPNVLGIDSGTSLWSLLKDWTDTRARRSKAGVAKLRDDPDAEIDAPMNLWNDAKARWREVVDALMAWDGIAVVVARAAEVTKVENGQPTKETEYRVEAEKTLVFDATAQVRFEVGKKPRLVTVKSLFLEVPVAGVELPRENTLDHLVFDILSGGKPFAPSALVVPQLGVPVGTAKTRVLQAIQKAVPRLTETEAKAEAGKVWKAAFPGDAKEVTEAALATVLAEITGPPDTDPDAQEKPPAAPEAASNGKPREKSADEVIREVRAMDKKTIVPLLAEAGLSTSGKLDDLRDRYIESLGVATAPFEVPDGENSPQPEAEGPGPEGETGGNSPPEADQNPDPESEAARDLPEVRDIPEGWREEVCICNAPTMHQPGNYAATIVHLDPKLDEDHQAENIF